MATTETRIQPTWSLQGVYDPFDMVITTDETCDQTDMVIAIIEVVISSRKSS